MGTKVSTYKKIEIEIPNYSTEQGVHINWVEEFEISLNSKNGTSWLRANRQGLVSLARLFLTLAEAEVRSGTHIHLDQFNSLEEGSDEFIIERV